MAITTKQEIEAAILKWVNRTDLTALAPDFLQLAQDRVYKEMRTRGNEATLNVTLASGVAAVPSDYIELKFAYLDGSPTQPVLPKNAEWIHRKYNTRSSDSKPKFIAREAENFIFGPYPDANYTLKGIYYKRLTQLTDTANTNWFTTNAPELLLFASLAEAGDYLDDMQMVTKWEAKYQNAKNVLNKEIRMEKKSGGPLYTVAE